MKQLDLNRRLRAVLAGLLALVLLGGCSGPQQGPVSSVPGGEPVAAASQPPAADDDEDYDASAGVIDKTVFSGTVLEETEDAGREYLDETLFLGDSNTYRYMMYGDENDEAFTGLDNNIGVVSMGAGAITTLKCMQFKGYSAPVTMPEAVALMQPRRIIVCFGTNNLGGGVSSFIKAYREGLAAIHKAYEYADIIVSAVPPLDQQRENSSLSMKQVDAFNAAIVEMCKEEGYKFLDTSEALKDPATGWARKDYTLGDGVHLSKAGVTALFQYIRTHAYITEDARPKPLKKIPKAQGVPPGLITQDPIAVRGGSGKDQDKGTVPVEFVAAEGGSIKGETSQKVKPGEKCETIVAVPDEGWEFDHWTITLGSSRDAQETLTFVVPGNADANGIVVTAHFVKHEHKWKEQTDKRVEPTCAKEGTAYYACTGCEETKSEKLPLIKHSYDLNGVCTVCGAKFCTLCQQTGHTSDKCPNVTPPPTPCGVCGSTDHTTENHPSSTPACSICGGTDHTSDACPNAAPSPPVEPDPPTPETPPEDSAPEG